MTLEPISPMPFPEAGTILTPEALAFVEHLHRTFPTGARNASLPVRRGGSRYAAAPVIGNGQDLSPWPVPDTNNAWRAGGQGRVPAERGLGGGAGGRLHVPARVLSAGLLRRRAADFRYLLYKDVNRRLTL
jgi:hypothetical protein